MSSFMVTTDGSTRVNVRSGAGTGFGIVSTISVGTILTSLERRSVPMMCVQGTTVTGNEVWHRIGTNRWVNEVIDIFRFRTTRNLVPIEAWKRAATVSVATANIRAIPGGLVGSVVATASRGTSVGITHRTGSNSGICNLGGHWLRRTDGRWMHSSTVTI